MLFNSLSFILFFLPVALAGFYALAAWNSRWAAAWLVAVSFVFYSWWTASLVFLLAGSIAFNFLCGALILRAQQREALQSWLLRLGICGDLLLIIYYKYFFGLLNWLGFHGLISLSHPYSVVMPLGISFFTFTQIGYLVDCKGGVVKTNRLLDYCLFVTFFPHLIAGPILHHREMMPQFADPKTYRFRWENLAVGTALFVIGLFKKVVIADYFIMFVSDAFNDTHGLPFFNAWDGALSYSLQLYFDFSGYSDMAIGLAILFGLRFPANFNSPYRAANIIDYWQRFHMTLTRYITLYLYNPVALWISRRRMAQGKSVSRKAISTPEGFFSLIAFPTFFSLILAGIWHGAGLTFVVFGLLHAVYLTINHAWRSFGPRVPETPPHPVLRITTTVGKVGLTYLAVVVAQVFFRASSVRDAVRFLKGMTGAYGFSGHAAEAWTPRFINPHLVLLHGFVLAGLYIVVWTMPNSLQLLDKYKPTLTEIRLNSPILFECKPTVVWAVVLGLVSAVALLEITGMTEFIYFRF
jgi:D-alanyl-lipoteichoic acid acyltransferase DltB (MBOAT superfamily)